MRRRDLFAVAAGAAALWPLGSTAQRPARVAKVGVLLFGPEKDSFTQAIVRAFAQGLARLGWVEGGNIHIEYRFAAGDAVLYERYAAELVAISPDALLASAGPAVRALRAHTSTIPIVFVVVPDPVGLGIVQTLAHPGGNITGFTSFDAAMIGKWLQLLKEIAPDVTRVAVIFNPDTALVEPETAFAREIAREIEAAPAIGMAAMWTPVHNIAEIEEAIATLASEPGGGLICLPDSFNVAHREAIIAAAIRHRIPLASLEQFARDGGLISYWFDVVELHAQTAGYIDRILKGAKPTDLPVQQPTKYLLIINLKTAKALGLTVPQSLLQRADEVIE